MNDYPYQITEDTRLGKLTFFIRQTNEDMLNALWQRWFKITVFYNGTMWHMNHDMSIYDPLINELNSTEMILSYSCYGLVEYIIKELELNTN